MSWALCGLVCAAADRPESLELQVKAAFLYNFAKFVDWPGGPAGPAAPIVFCVMADQPLFETLEPSFRGKNINGRPVAAREISGADDTRRCQILFLGGSEKKHAGEVLDKLAAKSVLTVGDGDHFTERGGMIQLIKEASRFRFTVNVDAVNRTGLRISSKLLQLADVVHDSGLARAKP